MYLSVLLVYAILTHKLELSEWRKHQLRKCLHKTQLQAIFLIRLMGKDPVHSLGQLQCFL